MPARLVWTLAAAVALFGFAGLSAARADGPITFGPAKPKTPAIYRSTNSPAQDRLLAKTAFTQVLANKGETLGMRPPANLQPYAPVFPDGLIVDESQSSASPAGGRLEYAAPGSLRTVLDFYEDAAALHHLPFKVAAAGPDTLVFTASDGQRRVQAKLTRQWKSSTEVDLSYD